jgi:O-succinylbenzoic acid--CoA ligase
VPSLVALDFALGPELEVALRHCVASNEAFCVLDQRVSDHRRKELLNLLEPTVLWTPSGRTKRREGRGVDDDIGLVMLTSGSSGTPKAAELTWEALYASARITQASLRAETPPVWFPCLPANHIGGLAVLLRAILSDATLVWGEPSEIGDGPRRGATHVALVRTQLSRYDVSGYHTVLLGGARPPHDLAPNVVTTWGMTETGSGIVYDGRMLDEVDVVAIEGQLAVRSPTLFRSYRNAPRPRIIGPDGLDDWFPTGDAGDVHDNQVRVRGRMEFVINSGGEKIWPEDLESIIGSLTRVHDVAVAAINDPEWGDKIVAFVTSEDTAVLDEILAVVNERVGPWAKPKEIRFVKEIPRTANGKIRRDEISRMLQPTPPVG